MRRRKCCPCEPSDTRPDRGVVTVETRATNQREEMVMTFKRSVLITAQAGG